MYGELQGISNENYIFYSAAYRLLNIFILFAGVHTAINTPFVQSISSQLAIRFMQFQCLGFPGDVNLCMGFIDIKFIAVKASSRLFVKV